MTSQRASKKQQELLQFIDGFIKGNGYGPSYREVMRALDYKSVSTVAVHVNELITKGYLEKKDNSARSLNVISLRPHDGVVQKQSDIIQLLDQAIAAIDDESDKATLEKALAVLKRIGH